MPSHYTSEQDNCWLWRFHVSEKRDSGIIRSDPYHSQPGKSVAVLLIICGDLLTDHCIVIAPFGTGAYTEGCKCTKRKCSNHASVNEDSTCL
eukprot:2762095-Pyramimonas_sp.AAC.2